MTSKIVQPDKPAIKYPCLMESTRSGAVVLFTGETIGTALYTRDGKGTGSHHTRWAPPGIFPQVPFTGEVHLSNSGEGYPCLMKHRNAETVLLCPSEHEGTVVSGSPLGRCLSHVMVETFYEPFHGTVILRNTPTGVQSALHEN